MHINISDAGKSGARSVTVTDTDGKTLFTGSAADTKAAHALIKDGRKNDWATKAAPKKAK